MSLRERFFEGKIKEFNFVELEIINILKSNEEMLKYSSHVKDYELLEYRKENIIFLNEAVKKLNKIKEEIQQVDPSHYIIRKTIDDLSFNDNKNIKGNNEVRELSIIDEVYL